MQAECVSAAAAADSEPRWTLDKAQSQRSVRWLQRVWPRNTLQSSSPLDDGDRRSLAVIFLYLNLYCKRQRLYSGPQLSAQAAPTTQTWIINYRQKNLQTPVQFILLRVPRLLLEQRARVDPILRNMTTT